MHSQLPTRCGLVVALVLALVASVPAFGEEKKTDLAAEARDPNASVTAFLDSDDFRALKGAVSLLGALEGAIVVETEPVS